ncbi:MAG: hypothetical protein R3E90_01605 [Marinicella sp.]
MKIFIVTVTLFYAANAIPQESNIKLSLDGTDSVSLSEHLEFSSWDNSVMIKLSEPVICHRRTVVPSSGMKAEIVDPNGDGIQTILNDNLSFRTSTKTVTAKVSDISEACVTYKGAKFGDLIFHNGFLPGLSYEVETSATEPGLNFAYTIYYPNETGSQIYFDIKEFFSKEGSGNAYFQAGLPVSWSCNIVDLSDYSTTACPGFTTDTTNGKMQDVFLENNTALKVDVVRKVDQLSQIGGSFDLMTAVFLKASRHTYFFTDVEYYHQAFDVINNNAPTINWGVNYSTIQFLEGATTPRTDLTFFIHDSTADNFPLEDLDDYIVSVNDKLSVSNIRVNRHSATVHRVRFDLVPNPDDENYFTTGSPDLVRVQVADALGLFSNVIELGANISPVNDAPSFNVACTHIVIDPTPPVGGDVVSCAVSTNDCGIGLNGNFSADDFFCNVSPGPYEVTQTVSFSIVDNLIGGSNPNVIDASFLGGITASSNLADLLIFTNDNEIGEATFRLMATDNDQNPLSSVPSPEITVEVKPVSYAVAGDVIEFPSSNPPATYVMNLFVYDYFGQTGAYDYVESVTISAANANTNDFLFNTRLEDGMDFYVEQGGFTNAGSNCSIDAQGNQAGGQPPRHQQIVNGADVNVVVDCSQ